MLLFITQWLASDVRAFSVFNYITVRAVLATMTALVIAIVLGPAVIARLQAMKIGQAVRDDGPQTHLSKKGTPTMGGALVLLSIAITTLLWADLSNRFVWVVLLVTMGFGAIGWVDDYRKVVRHNPKGMAAKTMKGLIACLNWTTRARKIITIEISITTASSPKPSTCFSYSPPISSL